MHDPSFLAVDVRFPFPVVDRWRTKERRKGRKLPVVSRRTNPDNLGERVYPWWQLQGYSPHVGPICFRFPVVIEVWHDEPGGGDMGTVCNYRDRRRGAVAHARWLWEHRAHCRVKFMPIVRWRHRLDRCADCGGRFLFRPDRTRIGAGWDSPETIHDRCHRIRHLRGHVADLARYVRDEADETNRWRVRRNWIGDLDHPGVMVPYFRDVGVGKSDLTVDDVTEAGT